MIFNANGLKTDGLIKMVISKLQLSLLSVAIVAVTAVLTWLLLKPGLQEDFTIGTSIKPDTYIATKLDETDPQESAVPQSGIPDGYGIVTHPDGSTYVGNFVNGQSHGQGKITYSGGASYEGIFSEGMPHGKGVCTYSSGQTEDCVFLLGQRQ